MSSSTGRTYPLKLLCTAWRVPRSSVYALRSAPGGVEQPGKRGPKTALSDEELVAEIRTVLSESPFVGEGHRKVRARLAAKGIRAGKNRVLRLMRESGLLAPVRRGHPRGEPGSRRPDPDGTARRAVGDRRGAAVDAGGGLVLVLRRGRPLCDRRGGLARGEEGGPLRGAGAGAAGRAGPHGGLRRGDRRGRLGLRHDWGSQYRAKAFQAEIKPAPARSSADGRPDGYATHLSRKPGPLHGRTDPNFPRGSGHVRSAGKSRRSAAAKRFGGLSEAC